MKSVKLQHSLRTQLLTGAVVLLGVTVFAVGYFLIVHQEATLTAEMEKTIILQGRNIALSSEKLLLRSDPEFELYPLVTRILGDSPRVLSVVIVDRDAVIQGHKDLVMVARKHVPDMGSYLAVSTATLRSGESLYENKTEYMVAIPIMSSGQQTGTVYLGYSKDDLNSGIKRAYQITLFISIVALLLGLVGSFVFFRHISRPIGLMLDGVDALARGDLSSRIIMPTKNEFAILANAFNEMSGRIAEAQDTRLSQERIEHEIGLAREIQELLVPKNVLAPKGFEIGHYYESANEVGGDYLDVIPVDDNRVVLAMADVSGKGVPGLVVMAMVKALLQELAITKESPRDILCSLNSALQGKIKPTMFVTAVVSVLDSERGRITVANAGHNPLIRLDGSTGKAELVKLRGIPLGPFDSEVFAASTEDREIVLGPGDLVLKYTDGLNDSKNSSGTRFTINRIVELALKAGPGGARTLVDELVGAEKQFRDGQQQFDDITILAVSAKSEVRSPELVK